MKKEELVIIRGGGDLATGVIQKFYRAGIPTLVLEVPRPTAIRRTVSLCEAVYAGTATVEDVTCKRIESFAQLEECLANGIVPLLIDPKGESIAALKPHTVIDSILAKRNLGTNHSLAPITIALGPGFCAGPAPDEVDIVIETMRGHDLGRLIFTGKAFPNTGVPGEIGGQSAKRVLHTPIAGVVHHHAKIGEIVTEGAPVFDVDGVMVTAPFTGLLRGLIEKGLTLPKHTKAADIDPRTDVDCFTISDKARCLGGSALEAYLYSNKKRISTIK